MSGHWLPVPHGSGWAFVVIAVFFLLLLAARQLYIAKADLTWARAHSIVELVQLDVAMGGVRAGLRAPDP